MPRLYHLAMAARPQDASDINSEFQLRCEDLFFEACMIEMPAVFDGLFLDTLASSQMNPNERIDDALQILLARAFSDRLRDEVGPHIVPMIVARNNVREDGSCASHDFCDPNMLMLAAFDAYGVPAPVRLADGSPERQAADRLWNAVWERAKNTAFAPSTPSGA